MQLPRVCQEIFAAMVSIFVSFRCGKCVHVPKGRSLDALSNVLTVRNYNCAVLSVKLLNFFFLRCDGHQVVSCSSKNVFDRLLIF